MSLRPLVIAKVVRQEEGKVAVHGDVRDDAERSFVVPLRPFVIAEVFAKEEG
jgi:hypothetical protein